MCVCVLYACMYAGYKLVSVPYWEWDKLKGADDKSHYLLSRLLSDTLQDE
jgi:hypothetical protein